MYYPYLRARQFELISLRELAAENIIQNFSMPILEPVKESFNNLNIAHKFFHDFNYSAYLIANPLQGELPGDTETFLNYKSGLGESRFNIAFHYSNNADYIISAIQKYQLTDCCLICLDNFVDDDKFRDLCQSATVTRFVLLDPNKYRTLDRFFKAQNKIYIRLDDIFERQLKNADFLNIQAHKFSEEHLYYRSEGYTGFSDYTVLPSEYIDGGSTPRAVVIHLTYLNPAKENQIWIRHFTSNTNDSIANVQGKFAEAAQKAITFCDQENLNNSAIEELRQYYQDKKYPGLGTVKKISIKNHLTVVSNYLRNINE